MDDHEADDDDDDDYNVDDGDCDDGDDVACGHKEGVRWLTQYVCALTGGGHELKARRHVALHVAEIFRPPAPRCRQARRQSPTVQHNCV